MNNIKLDSYGREIHNTRVAIFDADSIAFIVGWNHKDRDDVDAVIENTDDFLHTILQAAQTSYFIGMLSAKETSDRAVMNFRNAIAVTQPYKGQRGEKPDWYQKWAPIIEDRMIDHWGFYRSPYNVETDDVVVSLQFFLNQIESCTPIICGNDKDILQSPGHHYDFRKNTGQFIDKRQGNYNLFYQVLMGDKTDNIPGLAGCGKVGAAKILDNPELDTESYHLAVLHAFTEKMGVDRGIKSFYENYMLCKLLTDVEVISYELQFYDLKANEVREIVTHQPEVGDIEPDLSGLFTVE